MTVALIGAGAMGGAIGARLLATGTDLHVYDLDPAKVAGLVALGAGAAPTAAMAAQGVEAVILSLNTAHVVRAPGRIDNMVKDLNGAQDLARATHTAMPLTAVCAEVHRLLTAAGLSSEDQAALMEYFKGPKPETAP